MTDWAAQISNAVIWWRQRALRPDHHKPTRWSGSLSAPSVNRNLVDHLCVAHHKVQGLAHSHELGGGSLKQEGGALGGGVPAVDLASLSKNNTSATHRIQVDAGQLGQLIDPVVTGACLQSRHCVGGARKAASGRGGGAFCPRCQAIAQLEVARITAQGGDGAAACSLCQQREWPAGVARCGLLPNNPLSVCLGVDAACATAAELGGAVGGGVPAVNVKGG